jgi:hypothetical protein
MNKETEKMSITIGFLFAFLATIILIPISCSIYLETNHLTETNRDFLNFTVFLVIAASIFLIGIIRNFQEYLQIRRENE